MGASTPTYVGGLNASVDGEGFFITFPKSTETVAVADMKKTDFDYTRVGQFNIDGNGYLTDANGNFVYGFRPDNVAAPTKFDGALVAIKVPTDVDGASFDGNDSLQLTDVKINSLGEISGTVKSTDKDKDGKTVSIGASESGTEQNATEILKLSGLTSKLVHMVNLDYADAAGKLASGEIDALFCTAGIRTAVIEELAKECDLRLLSIDDTCLEKLLATTKEYSKYVIPANTYSGQDEDVTTIGVKAVLLASDALSEKTVEKLTEILFSHAQDLAYATSLDAAFDETDASSGVTIPFHPGAAAYYAGQGISVNTK